MNREFEKVKLMFFIGKTVNNKERIVNLLCLLIIHSSLIGLRIHYSQEISQNPV